MLLHTFSHVQGIGFARQQRLWSSGCRSWDDLLSGNFDQSLCGLSNAQLELLRTEIERDKQAFLARDIDHLSRRFKPSEHWRFYKHFFKGAVFLDIETTGTDPSSSLITVVGLYSRRGGPRVYIDGINLQNLPDDLSEFEILVTFNGSSFDLPFIRRTFPDIKMPPAHIDCRWLARKAGLSGGLKKIEKDLEISRNPDVCLFSGAEAPLLWQRYLQADDHEALRLLVHYNLEDTMNLEAVLSHSLILIYAKHVFLGVDEGNLPTAQGGFCLDANALIERARHHGH